MAYARWNSAASLLRHRPFRIQFFASSTSTVGSALTPVALTFGVLEATGSVADLGYALSAYSVTQLAFMLVGGVWADRFPRQWLMMLAEGVRVITQISFGLLLLTGHAELWSMVVLQAATGMASAFFLPASVGLAVATSPPGLLQEANGLISLTRNLACTAGPIVAGAFVISIGAGWVLIIDGLIFLGSMLLLSRLPPVERDSRPDTDGFWRSVVGGWREVSRRSWLWTSTLHYMFFSMAFVSYQVLGPALFSQKAQGGFGWGAVVGGLGAGQVLGTSITVWFRPLRLLLVGRLAMLAASPMLVLLAWDAQPIMLILAGALAGFATSFPYVLWKTVLQQKIPDAALARVSSFDYLGSWALQPVGIGLAATMVDRVGADAILLASALVIVAACLLSLLNHDVRWLTRTDGGVSRFSVIRVGAS